MCPARSPQFTLISPKLALFCISVSNPLGEEGHCEFTDARLPYKKADSRQPDGTMIVMWLFGLISEDRSYPGNPEGVLHEPLVMVPDYAVVADGLSCITRMLIQDGATFFMVISVSKFEPNPTMCWLSVHVSNRKYMKAISQESNKVDE
ncbi:hypothetical protein AVEN_194848-1 [Araneus ventricosus]|uniref:Uncharacterized protein n=1 Tax=Araneus ventricosus TaxID=182803 RepID=A0A4Y2B3M3_ARAVE|nr:hypothetical protein AVEN_194848-1 [Araneus ventricosus]